MAKSKKAPKAKSNDKSKAEPKDKPNPEIPQQWISYADPFEHILKHVGDVSRVFDELNAANPPQRWTGRTGVPRLLSADETPEMSPVFFWTPDDRLQLEADGLQKISFMLNGEPGRLDLWKPSLKKYISKTDERVPQTEAELKIAKRPRSTMLKKDWIQQAVEAFKLRCDFPDKTAHGIKDDLALLLQNNGRTVPDDGRLWELVNWVFEFDRAPLDRKLMPPRVKSERKRKPA